MARGVAPCAVDHRDAAAGGAGPAVVLGGGAGDAGLSRILPGRRALEAIHATRLDRRSLRRRACATTRHDLGVLAWRGAAVVAGRGRLADSAATTRRRDLRILFDDPWRAYFLLWAITPMLFFTVSGNVLPTYVLPGLPAFALLFADVWRPLAEDAVAVRATVRHVLVTGVVICIAFVVAIGVLRGRMENELSHKALARTVAAQRSGTDQRLVYMTQQPVSALFYSQGAATKVADAAALAPYLADPPADFYVLRERDLATLPAEVRARLAPLGDFGEYRLFREVPR